MLAFIENILKGVKQWVEGLLNPRDFVIASHVNELTEKCSTALQPSSLKTINGNSLVGSGNITISGGGSKFVHIEAYIDRRNGTELYIAVPKGMDLDGTGYELRHYRRSRTILRGDAISTTYKRTTGWHVVWQQPWQKASDRQPLIQPYFYNESRPDFTSGNFDFYRVVFYYEGDEENYGIRDYIYNMSTDTGYKEKIDGDIEWVHIGRIMSKLNGICLVKNGEIVSNFATFRIVNTNGGWFVAP